MKKVSFSRKVALRYLWSRRSEAFITIITVISILGVAIGVMVLTMVMAVMTGFEYELREKIVSTNSHIVVRKLGGSVDRWRESTAKIRALPGIESVSPFTYHQALIRADERSSGLLIRGIEPGSSAAQQLERYLDHRSKIDGLLGPQRYELPPSIAATGDFADPLVSTGAGVAGSAGDRNGDGDVADDSKGDIDGDRAPIGAAAVADLPGLIVGRELARSMAVFPGGAVSLLSPNVGSTPFGLLPRFKRFVISATYSSGLLEYESGLAYMALEDAQRFFRMGDTVSGFEVRVRNIYDSPQLAHAIVEQLGGIGSGFYAQDWTETNKPLWDAIRLEKKVYFIVLLLIIIMASFSIVTTLIMMVLEKRRDIAVLKTLGATSAQIANIFRIQGTVIGAFGTLLGLAAGYTGSVLLREYGFPLDEKVFPMSTLPVRIDAINFLVIGAAAFLICSIATIYPARRASRLDPAEVLRYE